jgi:pyruvate dehydrogenase E2 component (dihydrolipoamide acetyltransferase)
MAEVIIMPKLGFNMSVGKLVKWYKNEGDPVTKGEPIFAIETDKTSIDIEATQDGVFRKKFIEEGDEIEVTLPIAIVGGADENIDALIQDVNKQLNKEDSAPAAAEAVAPAAEESAPAAPAAAAPVAKTAGGKIKITPRARRVAKENGLSLDSLEEIIGTGYQGGICERDILEFLDATRVRITPVARKMAEAEGISLDDLQGSGIHGKIMKKDVEAAIAAAASAAQAAASAAEKAEEEAPKFSPDGKEIVEAVPYSGVRKIIGDRLAESKFTAPHLYFTQKVNLEKLLELRKQVNAAQDRKTSVTDYIAFAFTSPIA